MRPSLTTPDETAPVTVPVVAQIDKPDAVETDTKLPDWAKATEHSIGDTQLVVVTGEIGATVDEAVSAGRIAVVERLRSDFSAVHPQSAGWEPPASVAGDATSFDDVYEREASLDAVYARIVDALVEAADDHGEVLYAVPGSPLERLSTRLHGVRSDLSFDDEPSVAGGDTALRSLHARLRVGLGN